MAINSRDKGKNGERELSNLLKEQGFETRRGQQFCGTSGDADVVGLDGIHIEVKRVEALNVDKAMEQAIRDHKEGTKPTVFHRKNRKPWLVTMLLDDWITLYKEWRKLNEEHGYTGNIREDELSGGSERKDT
jgi:Holliday junction resolvase